MLINFYNICGVRVGIHAPDMTILTEYPKLSKLYEEMRFCDRVRYYSPWFTERCAACDLAASRMIHSTKKSYIYHCHMGFMEALIPIKADGKIICALMIGQVRSGNTLSYAQVSAYLESGGISHEVIEALIPSWKFMPIMDATRFEALVYFLEICAQSIYDNHWIRVGEKSLIDNFKDYIHENLYEELYISKTASALNVSASHLSRVIAQNLGTTFTQYLNTQRMETAKQLLRTTQMTVNEISECLCYNNATYFMRIFKQYTGMTCMEYRNAQSHFPPLTSVDIETQPF
ncbi:MAG: PocR ligand-binding domain-containing protein [Clostridia bacterium]|nr:PocR ligand-binding domain-containing protein [Clostridia bacterium]